MDISYIDKFYSKLHADNLSFIYQGEFSDSITEKILHLSEYSINHADDLAKIRNKVSFVIVECFQNIVRHGDGVQPPPFVTDFPGLFLTRSAHSTFYITSANLIDNINIEPLKAKLENINSLDKEQIKALALEVLSNQEMSAKGGAGLGLIEMAKRSGQPLNFAFESFSDSYSFFYLTVKVKGKNAPEISELNHLGLKDGIDLHKTMRDENILMVYKGDFAHSTILPLLNMIEENLNKQGQELMVKKRVYLVLVEALQNICRHGKENNHMNDAILMIGKEGDNYCINTGNFVDNQQVEALKSKLNNMNLLSREELKTLYKKELKEGSFTDGKVGLGIIDMARESKEKLRFDFKQINDSTTFFSLSILV